MNPKSPSPATSAATRQTSDRVSSIAGRLLAHLTGLELDTPLVILGCSLRDLRALAGSALNQDETKGKRPKKSPAKRRKRAGKGKGKR